MSRAKKHYSLFGDLAPTEYEALKMSIARDGIQVPTIMDDQGGIVDGVHRDRACMELGIPCPSVVQTFASEAEKWQSALTLNVTRRQLNRQQKRDLVAAYLKADPKINDNWLGELIGGISKNTVGKVRTHLVATGQIDKFAKLRGKDGKQRPATYARIIATTPKEQQKAIEAVNHLPTSCKGKIVDILTAARRARKKTCREARDQEIIVPLPDDAIRLYHCPFQRLEETAGLSPSSVQLVFTDPPYEKAFVPQFHDLAAFAGRVLVEGGLFVSWYGHLYLPQFLAALGQHLEWGWMVSSSWDGPANIIHQPKVWSRWEPIVVYCKKRWTHKERFEDVSHTKGQEKDWHPWQKTVAEVETLVSRFSRPGDLIVDPCGGAFTTAVACKRLGRRFVGCDVEADCVRKGLARLKQDCPPPPSSLT